MSVVLSVVDSLAFVPITHLITLYVDVRHLGHVSHLEMLCVSTPEHSDKVTRTLTEVTLPPAPLSWNLLLQPLSKLVDL